MVLIRLSQDSLLLTVIMVMVIVTLGDTYLVFQTNGGLRAVMVLVVEVTLVVTAMLVVLVW